MPKKQFCICLALSVLLIVVLLILFMTCDSNKESFCNCLGMSYQTCADPARLQYLYKNGMTENDIQQNGFNGRIAAPYDAAAPLLDMVPSRKMCRYGRKYDGK